MSTSKNNDQGGYEADGQESLSDADLALLRLWRSNLVLQDSRGKHKGLLVLAAKAMVNEETRTRLVNDTDNFLRELPDDFDLPANVRLKFVDDAEETLTIVLPPRAGEAAQQPQELRDLLKSRTTFAGVGFGADDIDFGNIFDGGPAPSVGDYGDPNRFD